jgi:tetratricopeptide (TPR) repeat protein
MEDVARARALDPDDPRVWELRGRLEIVAGDPASALTDLDRAIALGGGASVREPRAAALMALDDARGAIDDWSRALEHDPESAAAFLGRAEALARLHQWDPAIADLEQAAGWSEGQPALRLRIALGYARCLAPTPAHLPRLVAMIRRAWVSPLAS